MSWTLDKASVERAWPPWLETNPTPQVRRQVEEFLMDLCVDPIRKGQEEETRPGVFWGRVASTNVGVLFVVSLEERRVFLVGISPALD